MREEVLGALAGRRIVITRPRAQAAAWMRQLRSLGAAPLLGPAVEVVPPSDWQALDSALVRPQGRRRPPEQLPPPGATPTLPLGSTAF